MEFPGGIAVVALQEQDPVEQQEQRRSAPLDAIVPSWRTRQTAVDLEEDRRDRVNP